MTEFKKIHPIDEHVGTRIKQRRAVMNVSQEKLAEALGLTFQQVQKYERGTNRIGASRLYDLSKVLDVPVGFFFEELTDYMAPGEKNGSAHDYSGLAEEQSEYEFDPMAKRETLELVRAYYRIRDPQVRKRLFEMCKVLASASDNE